MIAWDLETENDEKATYCPCGGLQYVADVFKKEEHARI